VLEECYSEQFRALISEVKWDLELPSEWSDYFHDRSSGAYFPEDVRSNQRLKVRLRGLLWFERTLPFRPRSPEPIGIYTRDFSRNSAGLLAPLEIFPEEQISLVLPSLWMSLLVVRVQRRTSKCYEIGARLIRQHEISLDAFHARSTESSLV
jgi:hypothetical protein